MKLAAKARRAPDKWLAKIFAARFWPKQCEIIRSFFKNRVTLVPSCHASGKSFTAAHAALAAFYLHPHSKVITTATTWHQVESILWSELRAAYARAKFPLGGPAPLKTSIELAPDWQAFGVSTNNPTSMQGQHAPGGVFFIVDEGDGIEPEIWEGIKANLSTGDCHLLVIGNPVDPESKMAAMCNDEENTVIPINAFDTPNFSAFNLTIEDFRNGKWKEKTKNQKSPAPWLLSPQWVADVMREEGEESPFFISRVLARWPDVAEDALIKQAWIEKAWLRWQEADAQTAEGREARAKLELGPTALGHDVARFGDDKTVTAIRRGLRLFIAAVGSGLDTEAAAQQAMRLEVLEHMRTKQRPPIFADVAGVGAGVFDMLKKTTRAFAVDNAEAPSCNCQGKGSHSPQCPHGQFFNKRAELYWNLREMLRTQPVALDPRDRRLAQELRAIRFKINKGRVQIEEKADIKKRLGRSPDRADALCLSVSSNASTAISFLEAMQAAQGKK